MSYNNKNLVPISIRVEQYVLDDFKKESQHDMFYKGAYQKLINNVLKAWVAGSEMPPRYIEKKQKKTRR